jgi:hypothetical protein
MKLLRSAQVLKFLVLEETLLFLNLIFCAQTNVITTDMPQQSESVRQLRRIKRLGGAAAVTQGGVLAILTFGT